MMDRESEKLERVICRVRKHAKLKICNSNQNIFRAVSELAELVLDGNFHEEIALSSRFVCGSRSSAWLWRRSGLANRWPR